MKIKKGDGSYFYLRIKPVGKNENRPLYFSLTDFNGGNRALLGYFLEIMLIARIGFDVGNTVAFDLEDFRATLFA
jgi:hypothetical protein